MASTRLSPIEKIGYGLGDFGSNVVFQTVIILLPSFYTDVFGLAPAAMGLMFLLVRLLDTVTDPIMGVIADNTDTRWGKFRPYLLWFSVPFAIVFVLTYWTPDLAGNQKLLYAYVTYAVLMLLYTVVNIPYCALGGVITADSQERVSANSYRFFLATSAGVLITFFGPRLITYFGKGNDQVGYPWAMAVFGVLAVFAFIGCFALTKERVVEAKPAKGSFWSDVGTLVKNDQWVVVAL
ncbi:MAG: MFS transporter, partial [Planctomycetaceae bacterium]|nr:MFS transporter [Planctomycetaceae bacterium]